MNNELPTIIESSFSSSSWTSRVLNEIKNEAHRHMLRPVIYYCSEMEIDRSTKSIFQKYKNQTGIEIIPVLFIGTITSWQNRFANIYNDDDRVRPIFIGHKVLVPGIPTSSVSLDRTFIMSDLVNHLYENGARRIALVGSTWNSAFDASRYNGYVMAMRKHHIFNQSDTFSCKTDVTDSINEFSQVMHQYDAVMFANDIAAICFISRAMNMNIDMPCDLMVTGFGDLTITKRLKTSLTTVHMDLEEIGRQAVITATNFKKNPKLLTANFDISCQILYGKSTQKPTTIKHSRRNIYPTKELSYSHKDLSLLDYLDKSLIKSRIDIKIIKGLLCGMTYGRLAEHLFISDSGLRYRLQKMFQEINVHSKEELIDLCWWYEATGIFD
jgi:DNA-binding LacI/PurR family transcriptional regulator